jgi:hypothetical protein
MHGRSAMGVKAFPPLETSACSEGDLKCSTIGSSILLENSQYRGSRMLRTTVLRILSQLHLLQAEFCVQLRS